MANDTSIGGASMEFTVDGSQAINALDQIEDKAGRVDNAVIGAAAALGGIGDRAGSGSQKAERAIQQLIGSVQRATAAIAAGQKGTASYFETLASQRGLNADALRPFVDQLRAAQEAQTKLAASATLQAEKQRAAAAAVAENRRAFEQQTQARDAYLEKLREEIRLLGMSESAQRAYKAAKTNEAVGGGAEGAALFQILERQRAAQNLAAQAARDEAEAQREAASAKKGDETFIASLQRQAAAIGKTRADLLELEAAQRGLTAQASPFIARLRESEKSLHGVGVSAGQTKAALAQLPAQFTDIFTQLAGGANPLLVLIQQGGQVKDSFGGIGNAAKALGGLLTPLRLAIGGIAGAAGVLALAYAQGSKEQDVFARGLILTGNVSGKTVGQLNEQAKAIAGVVGTQGKAAEALAQVVNAGGIAAGAFSSVAEAAIRLERVGGPAIEETVAQFAALGRDPLQAAGKLNEKVNFLTASLYQQIKALQDQGKTSEAARVAQEAYASALISRTQQIEARFGVFERAWKSLGDAAKFAWDKMLNIGRQQTIEESVAKAAAGVEAARTRLDRGARRGGTGNELRGLNESSDAAIALRTSEALLDTQREGLKIERQIAEAKAATAFQVQARIDTEHLVEASLSAQAKLEKERAAARTQLESSGRPQAEIDAALRGITIRSAAFQQSLAAVAATAEASLALVGTQARGELQHLQALREQGLLRERDYIEQVANSDLRVLQAERGRLEVQKQIEQSKPDNRAAVTAINGQLAAKDEEILIRRKQLLDDVAAAALRQANAVRDGMLALREEGEGEINAQLQQQREQRNAITLATQEYKISIDESVESMALELQTLGMEGHQRATLIEQFRIELELRRRIRQINATPYDSQADRQAAIDDVTAQAERAKAAAGARVWLDEYQKVNDQIGQSLTDALINGGQSAGELLKNYFKTLVLRPIVQAVVSPISGAIASFLSGAQGGGGYGSQGTNSLSSLSSLYGLGSKAWSWLGAGSSAGAGSAAAGAFVDAGGVGAAGNAALADYGITSGASAGAGASAGGAAASSSAASAIPIIGWIIAAILASKGAYEGGNTIDMLDKSDRDLGVGAFETSKYRNLSALGISDKWAQILSGAPLTARLFGHKASASGFGIGTIQDGDFVQDTSAPFQFGANTLNTGADKFLQDLSSRLAAGIGVSASQFGGGITQGLRVGGLTDRDRDNEVSSLLGIFDANNKLLAGVQTGTGAFGEGGPGAAASKIAAGDLDKWIADNMPVLIIQGLQKSDLADRFDTYFDSVSAAKLDPKLAEQMLQTATAVAQLTESFGPLGGAFSQLEGLSVNTFEKLAKASGGFDALGQNASTYYQAFYSETERTEDAMASITKTLKEAGVQAIPTTREGFRALVDSLKDLSTEADQKAFAALMKVAGAFNAVTQASDNLAAGLQAAIDRALPKFQTPAEQQQSAYAGIAGDLQKAGVSISVEALIGATKDQIRDFATTFVRLADNSVEAKTAVVDAAAALAGLKDGAAESAASIADRTNNLQVQLLQAQGRGTEALTIQREAELASLRALEKSTGVAAGTFTALQQQIYAATDATSKMVRQAQLLAGVDAVAADFLAPKDLANYRASRIQTTLAAGGIDASVQGILGASRQDILDLWNAVGDEGKQAILNAYGAWEELENDRTKAQRQSLEDQIDGLKRIKDLATDIQDFTRTLKFGDLSPLSSEAQLSEAQSLFDSTLAKARGGDAEAAGKLEGVANDLLNEASGAFASGPAYSAIFKAVTSALDEFGGYAAGLDPQIEALDRQLGALDHIDFGLSKDGPIVEALTDIHAALSGDAAGTSQGRTYVDGPTGSSGGLGGPNVGFIDIAPVRGTDATKQSEVLEKVLAKLDEILATSKEAASAAGGNAAVDQLGFNKVVVAVDALRGPLEQMAGDKRQVNNKAAAMR